MHHIKKYLLLYTLLPLIILMVASSYYRFMIAQDYTVGYEGYCDPYEQSCFVYCEDEACAEPFYYSWIERHAGTVHAMCGPLVTECEAAYSCAGDASCSITYCAVSTTEPTLFESLLGLVGDTAGECDDLTAADQPLAEETL